MGYRQPEEWMNTGKWISPTPNVVGAWKVRVETGYAYQHGPNGPNYLLGMSDYLAQVSPDRRGRLHAPPSWPAVPRPSAGSHGTPWNRCSGRSPACSLGTWQQQTMSSQVIGVVRPGKEKKKSRKNFTFKVFLEHNGIHAIFYRICILIISFHLLQKKYRRSFNKNDIKWV